MQCTWEQTEDVTCYTSGVTDEELKGTALKGLPRFPQAAKCDEHTPEMGGIDSNGTQYQITEE